MHGALITEATSACAPTNRDLHELRARQFLPRIREGVPVEEGDLPFVDLGLVREGHADRHRSPECDA